MLSPSSPQVQWGISFSSNQTFLPIPPAKWAIDVSEVIIKLQFSMMEAFSRKSQVESIWSWQLTNLSLKEQ